MSGRERRRGATIELRRGPETAILVGLELGRGAAELPDVEESLDELERLCDTAGVRVVARTSQRRATPDVRTFIGAGKADEVKALVDEHCADVVVFADTNGDGTADTSIILTGVADVSTIGFGNFL